MRCSGLITRTDKRQGPRVLGIASEFHLSGMRYLGSRVLGFGFGVYIHIYIYIHLFIYTYLFMALYSAKKNNSEFPTGVVRCIYIYMYMFHI